MAPHIATKNILIARREVELGLLLINSSVNGTECMLPETHRKDLPVYSCYRATASVANCSAANSASLSLPYTHVLNITSPQALLLPS